MENKDKGTLKAGMSREDVRILFKSKIYEFKKTPLCELTTDAFYDIYIHAHYDQKTNKLEGIEIYQPNHLIYKNDVVLLERDLKVLLTELDNKKMLYELDCYGINFEKGKIGVYVPHIDESCPECASVYVDLSTDGSLLIKKN